MGSRRGAGDLRRQDRARRHTAGAHAQRRADSGQGDLQEHRRRLRDPARREPYQARHQDGGAQAPHRQPGHEVRHRHDRRGAGAGFEIERNASRLERDRERRLEMTSNGTIRNGVHSTVNPDGPPAIAVEHITKRYGDFTAVDDVSFQVKEGEIFGLLGPNGAGKSTLIRMMTTLIPITGGKALIAGHDVTKEPDAARRTIGVIPQAMTSDIDLTVEENLSIYAKLYGVPRDVRVRAINDLLEQVELTKWRAAQTKTLSGGMRRRLEIARGLVHSPKIFFLDEPTTGLDPVSRVAVWEMLTKIKEQRRLTMLITTHYMDEADRLCDRIAIVDHGKLVALDTPTALKASVPGSNVIEVQFVNPPADWEQKLQSLADVTSVQNQTAGMFRVLTGNGSRTTTDLVEAAVKAGVEIHSLSVQNTTLDDVFVHYTGRQLRDEAVKAYQFVMQPRPGMQP